MKINWKVRFKNKAWLSAFIGAFIVFGFTMLRLFNIETPISEYEFTHFVESILAMLALGGCLIDPTTPGLDDSQLVLSRGEEEAEPNEQ